MSSRYGSSDTPWYLKLGSIITALVILAILIFGLGGFKTVDAREGVVLTRNGKAVEQWGPGLNWRFWLISNANTYSTARQTYESVAVKKFADGTIQTTEQALAESDAKYKELAPDSRALGGQVIDQAPFRLAYHTPAVLYAINDDCSQQLDAEGNPVVANPTNLITIYEKVGKTDQQVLENVVTYFARTAVREMLGDYPPAQLYANVESEQELLITQPSVDGTPEAGADPSAQPTVPTTIDATEEINQRLFQELCHAFHARGVVLEDFQLGKVDFNDPYESSVNQLQVETNNVQIEQEKANQQLQIGQGRIYSAQADATSTAIAVNAGANAIVTNANAVATANAVEIESYGGIDEYLENKRIEATGNWPITVIGDGAALPIYDLNAPSPTPSPTESTAPIDPTPTPTS